MYSRDCDPSPTLHTQEGTRTTTVINNFLSLETNKVLVPTLQLAAESLVLVTRSE